MNRTPPARPVPPTSHAAAVAIAIALLAGLCAPQAHAQAPEARLSPSNSEWGLGLAASARRKPYRGMGTDYSVLPLPWYENRWVDVRGPAVDLKLPSPGPVSFRLRGRYGFSDGYEASDSPYLAGMAERKGRVWLGGAALWHNSVANVSAEWLGSSDGQTFSIGLNRGFAYGRFRLTPRVSAQWVSDKYVDYYYGVRAAEVRVDRPYYEGESTVNVEAGLRVDYRLTQNQGLYLDVSATRLGSGIKDSPIVDRSHSTAVRIGYLYRF